MRNLSEVSSNDFSGLTAYVATVSHHFEKITQLYANYGILVRTEAVTNLQKDGGEVALKNLREVISNSLGLQLLSMWEIPIGDCRQTYSFPAAACLFSEHEKYSDTWCMVDKIVVVDEENSNLSKLIRLCVRLTYSEAYAAQKNLRNKLWGHKLHKTKREIKGDVFAVPTHGDLDRMWLYSATANRLLFKAVFEEKTIDHLALLKSKRMFAMKMLENFGVEISDKFDNRTQ